MKKMIVFVLVAGFLILGTAALMDDLSEKMFSPDCVDFAGEDISDTGCKDPAPLSGGPSGGDGGIPG